MANCHKLFQAFNSELEVTSTKKGRLKTSRQDLISRVRNHFEKNHPQLKPKFSGQGSYYLGTMIRTKEDECDLDLGVYFFPKPKETGTTLQGWIWDAVEHASSEKPQHRAKCVRVEYKSDYHIDIPVYYKDSEKDDSLSPYLAIKNSDWAQSDPKKFKDWFNNQKDSKGQLVRIVRYLKAWGDYKSKRMPNGITMTVLASKNFRPDDRDDVCLKNTLVAINDSLKGDWSCHMPTVPFDDLLSGFPNKQYFLDCIEALISDAKKAINEEKNELKASKLWKGHLGAYFPEGEDKEEANSDAKLNELKEVGFTVLNGKAKLNSEGQIQQKEGVDHKPHKYFGG